NDDRYRVVIIVAFRTDQDVSIALATHERSLAKAYASTASSYSHPSCQPKSRPHRSSSEVPLITWSRAQRVATWPTTSTRLSFHRSGKSSRNRRTRWIACSQLSPFGYGVYRWSHRV